MSGLAPALDLARSRQIGTLSVYVVAPTDVIGFNIHKANGRSGATSIAKRT